MKMLGKQQLPEYSAARPFSLPILNTAPDMLLVLYIDEDGVQFIVKTFVNMLNETISFGEIVWLVSYLTSFLEVVSSSPGGGTFDILENFPHK